MLFMKNQTVWMIPIRFWEEWDKPMECVVQEEWKGDINPNVPGTNGLYVLSKVDGHNVYVDPGRVFYSAEAAKFAGQLKALYHKLQEDDNFDAVFAQRILPGDSQLLTALAGKVEQVGADFGTLSHEALRASHQRLIDAVDRLAPALDTASHLLNLAGDKTEAELFAKDAGFARGAAAQARDPASLQRALDPAEPVKPPSADPELDIIAHISLPDWIDDSLPDEIKDSLRRALEQHFGLAEAHVGTFGWVLVSGAPETYAAKAADVARICREFAPLADNEASAPAGASGLEPGHKPAHVPETSIRTIADAVETRRHSELTRLFDAAGVVVVDDEELEIEQHHAVLSALQLADKVATLPFRLAEQGLSDVYAEAVIQRHLSHKVDAHVEYRNSPLIKSKPGSSDMPLFGESNIAYIRRMAKMDFEQALASRTGEAVFPDLFDPILAVAHDRESSVHLGAVQALAALAAMPESKSPQQDLNAMRDLANQTLAQFPNVLQRIGVTVPLRSIEDEYAERVTLMHQQGKQDVAAVYRKVLGFPAQAGDEPDLDYVRRAAKVDFQYGDFKSRPIYREISDQLAAEREAAKAQYRPLMPEDLGRLTLIQRALLHGKFYEDHDRASEMLGWLRRLTEAAPAMQGVSQEAEGDKAGWVYGHNKGSLYMYPIESGVAGGYEWVATTDPEHIGKPEDLDARDRHGDRLAACANACLGMAEPMTEVRALRQQAQGVEPRRPGRTTDAAPAP